MKQQCHISMIYLSWIICAGGLVFAAWRSDWLFAVVWLAAVLAGGWSYIRHFPRFSAVLGYGPITDVLDSGSEARPARVILYTALGCPFCPLMEQRLLGLQARLGFSLEEIDVTLRPDLLAAKGIRSVPVVEIDGRFLSGMVTTRELAAAIAQPVRTVATAG